MLLSSTAWIWLPARSPPGSPCAGTPGTTSPRPVKRPRCPGRRDDPRPWVDSQRGGCEIFDEGRVRLRAAGRMRDEPTGLPRKGALTCGGERPEQATSAVLGPERNRGAEGRLTCGGEGTPFEPL